MLDAGKSILAFKKYRHWKAPWAAAVLVVAAAGLVSLSPSQADVLLVRIDRAVSGAFPKEWTGKTRGVNELESSWIVLAERPAAFSAAREGTGLEVLDAAPAGKAYFFVRISGPDDVAELDRFGQVRQLEDRTALFWSGSDEAREILPARFEIARVRFIPDSMLCLSAGAPGGHTFEPRARAAGPAPNPLISQLVGRVSKAALTATISNLQNFQTRYASTSACEQSGAYLFDAFARLGLETEYETFKFNNNRNTSRNIVATLRGTTAPDREVVVGAHYDSYSDRASTLAPGADDNASGAAAVLEIARVLAAPGVAFDYTIKFVCFSAEEWGLDGSAHFAQAARSRGANILGALTMDMIAWPNGPARTMDLVVNRNSEWLADRFASAALGYEGLPTRKVVDNSWKYSDQSSFWDTGTSALCGIENEDSDNPFYHRTTDTLSTLNMDYGAGLTRAAAAAVAELAQPAVKANKYSLIIQAASGGTTIPAPGSYAYEAGILVNVSAIPAADHRFTGWSGDASGTAGSIRITMNADKTIAAGFLRIIYPPADLQGRKVLNRSLSQAEYINELSWNAPQWNSGLALACARVYRLQGQTMTRLADVPADQLSFWHRRVDKNAAYDYVIVFVDAAGREGDPGSLTIR